MAAAPWWHTVLGVYVFPATTSAPKRKPRKPTAMHLPRKGTVPTRNYPPAKATFMSQATTQT